MYFYNLYILTIDQFYLFEFHELWGDLQTYIWLLQWLTKHPCEQYKYSEAKLCPTSYITISNMKKLVQFIDDTHKPTFCQEIYNSHFSMFWGVTHTLLELESRAYKIFRSSWSKIKSANSRNQICCCLDEWVIKHMQER